MKHIDRAVATAALAAAVAAIAYFTKDQTASFAVGAIGMMFIWGNA